MTALITRLVIGATYKGRLGEIIISRVIKWLLSPMSLQVCYIATLKLWSLSRCLNDFQATKKHAMPTDLLYLPTCRNMMRPLLKIHSAEQGMEPDKRFFMDYCPLETAPFQVPCWFGGVQPRNMDPISTV